MPIIQALLSRYEKKMFATFYRNIEMFRISHGSVKQIYVCTVFTIKDKIFREALV